MRGCHSPRAPQPSRPFDFPLAPEPLTPPDLESIRRFIEGAPSAPVPGPGPGTAPQPQPETARRRRRRTCRYEPCEFPLPISWPTELPEPTASPRALIRSSAADREWEGIDRGAAQRRFAQGIRDAREFMVPPPNPCFGQDAEPNAPYDAHHTHPLYLGGEDAEYNLCALRSDRHQFGHPRLDYQTEHMDEYVECGICSPFLSRHPPGQTYRIVGSK